MNPLTKVFDEHIDFEGVGRLYFPTVKDLIKLGEDKYNLYIQPYRLTLEMFEIHEDIKHDIKLFDTFFVPQTNFNDEVSGATYYELLLESLSFYTKSSVVFDEENYCLKIGEFGIVNRDNFDALAEIILEMNNAEKIKPEIIPEFKNDRQRDIYMKIMEGRRKNAAKNHLSMATIINTVVHGGKSFIPYSMVKEMTMNQLFNSYNAILKIDSFFIDYKQYLVGVEAKNLDLTHWSNKIKL